MAEYRKDPLTGRWVIIAEGRASRPRHTAEESVLLCPFCPGNECETPDEIDSFRPKNEAGIADWKVRVVPNLFPAIEKNVTYPDHRSFRAKYGAMLDVDEPFADAAAPRVSALPGVGGHEVIVDTARHVSCVSDLREDESENAFWMYRQRLRSIRQNEHWAHVLIFKNVGEDAGATIYHAHSQLIAMPFLPPPIQRELFRAVEFRHKTELCYWCEHISQELNFGARIVEETKRFVLLCPYLSRFPYEMAIYPKQHVSHFESLDDMALSEMALLTRKAIKSLQSIGRGRVAYNMTVKSAPFFTPGPPAAVSAYESTNWFRELGYSFENAYHCHVSITPCITKAAGFEWGSGLHINPVSPETAAQKLRNALSNVINDSDYSYDKICETK